MNFVKKILRLLFAPSPLKLGILFTLFFCYFSTHYYIQKNQENSENLVLSFLNELHLKTIDYKLKFRGEREGHPDVAVLTVDERAIDHLGRWPWSRAIIAQTIEKVMEHGAKAIAFDMVFSEKNTTEAANALERLKSKNFSDPKIYTAIEEQIQQANTDSTFAKTIEKYADHLILGGYYENVGFKLGGANEKCANLISKQDPNYHFLENQELQVGALDDIDYELPEELGSFLEQNLQKLALQTKAKVLHLKETDQTAKVSDTLFEYCAKWLHPTEDKSLKQLEALYHSSLEKTEEWRGKSFDDFATFLRNLPKNPLNNIYKFYTNIPLYNEKTKHFGYFNAFPDKDGTVRRTALVSRIGDIIAPSLALKTAMLVNNEGVFAKMGSNPLDPNSKMLTDLQFMDLESGEFKEKIPVNSNSYLKINYAGPQKMFPHLSVAELFNGLDTVVIEKRYKGAGEAKKYTVNKKEWIKDKIFVFGVTAVGVFDLRVTPFEEIYPGLETHANIIDNILRKDFLFEEYGESSRMFVALLLLGIFSSIIVAKLGALSGLLSSFLGLALILYIDYSYFLQGVILNTILPIILLLSIYFFLTIYKYFTEEKTKRELKGTFQKYVSPAIVDEVLSNAKNIELGGKKINMSVLFSDIRGFTSFSEKLDPQALSDFLNSYLTPMTELVFKNKGTLDKYMGDAIMAFFGAPVQYKEHALMACKCALDMMDKLADLRKIYQAQGLPEMDIGIGINTGEMSVGNMGSETVRSYTVMGDAVNLGSRIEGINKQYGTNIIISEFTYSDVKEHVVAREIDRVMVKGKLEPVKIYELVGLKKDFKNQEALETIEIFNQGYQLYGQKKFKEAIELFDKAISIIDTDGPSHLFKKRSQAYIENPPEANWDGVFVMKTK